MFEEYLCETWRCPECGEIDEVQVDENTKKGYKRNSLDVFEFTGTMRSNLRVHCAKCGAECYME